ncbi:YsnF/AvaK domain-containing protein [Paenibacillus sp. FSL R7-0312]|uniref:YsnF/AvaK domain-containing protein n=1 Tax=Paenibacillus sp. FSL R7-0312 TaxID=2921682 RepID=UPI0030EE61C0
MDDPNTTGDAADTARHSVTDTVDAAFNGSGLEGRDDTGLDTMNSATEHDLPGTRALDDVNRPGMTGDVYSGTANGIDGTLDHTRTGRSNDLDEDRKLRLREEQLDVSKNKVQTGEVNVHKEIIEEQKMINVPVSEEQVEVRKNTVDTGEVGIHKREVQGTEQVQDTVRREEARVNKSGEVKVDGSDELLRDHSRSR